MGEPKAGQRHEDVERKWEGSHFFFPEKTWNSGSSGNIPEMLTSYINMEEDK